MQPANFNEISGRYEKDSTVQRNASGLLIELLRIGPRDDVLDLGCGTGGITEKIAAMTAGKVLGIDPSEGMVREARTKHIGNNLSFERRTAEDFSYPGQFDIVLSNSSFQWFCDPSKAVGNCFESLRRNGRMGIQAPATNAFCPNFLDGVERVKKDPGTSGIFSHFKSPWLFLENASDYEKFFIKAGFDIIFSRIEQTSSEHTPDEAYRIFESGAAAGYLNKDNYTVPAGENYLNDFRKIMKTSFQDQAVDGGRLKMMFNRIYLVAVKP